MQNSSHIHLIWEFIFIYIVYTYISFKEELELGLLDPILTVYFSHSVFMGEGW